ncbi:dTMP kinase [Thalassolituus oleivorans]|uniref:dTMP kinase n=1 Tax=Thalassolituus oleivorans TaxID=187493 RepID=UPI0023F2B15E|nr:AAA family ATPase [Thalassolituus oleivorans]|tara:strand:- start:11782 stop:12363 length:582 start_codon:yes stop_codon:yes gene_type:complete
MPFFIVLEGLDGVGKSTLARRLAESEEYQLMTTPGAELLPIRAEIVNGLGSSQTAKALFYAATVQAEGEKVRAFNKNGRAVIMDRYRASTIAYAQQRGVTLDLTSILCQAYQPHLSILLTLDEDERQQRLHSRGTTAEDIETLNPDFRTGVLTRLQSLCDIELDLTEANEEEAVSLLKQCINNHLLLEPDKPL